MRPWSMDICARCLYVTGYNAQVAQAEADAYQAIGESISAGEATLKETHIKNAQFTTLVCVSLDTFYHLSPNVR